jgi:hypothetical protein
MNCLRCKKTAAALIAAVMPAAMSGCASMYLNSDMSLLKIAPSSLGKVSASQRISLRYDNQTKNFEAIVDNEGGKLSVIALAFGARLFSVQYDGEHAVEKKAMPVSLTARRVVNDALLGFASGATLKKDLPTNCELKESGDSRELFCGGELVSQIVFHGATEASRWNGRVELHNLKLHYWLTIESREE